MKKEREQLEEKLELIRSTAPDFWRDPDGDGRRVPKRDLLAWGIAIAGGSVSQWKGELNAKILLLGGAQRRLAVAQARMDDIATNEYGSMIPGLQNEIARLRELIDASGPWVDHGQDALQRAVDEAVIAVAVSRAQIEKYEIGHLAIPGEVAAALATADRNLASAIEARDRALDRLTEDRLALAALRGRPRSAA